MIATLYGGPYSGQTMHLPQNTRYFAVGVHRIGGVKHIKGEYREYDSDGTTSSLIWLDPRDIEEAKAATSKDEKHAAQDLLRALRDARKAGTQQAREESARKAALIQAHWQSTMSDSMRERLVQEAKEQAAKEAASGAHFDASDEERWSRG